MYMIFQASQSEEKTVEVEAESANATEAETEAGDQDDSALDSKLTFLPHRNCEKNEITVIK